MAASKSSKTEFIHVRARRGQATDSHSLAERENWFDKLDQVMRKKTSEKMKYLQELVPGFNDISGKASMLDEIINNVQTLQKQVEFLSMKPAAVDPLIDFNMQSLIENEINSSICSTSISREMSSEQLMYPVQSAAASDAFCSD